MCAYQSRIGRPRHSAHSQGQWVTYASSLSEVEIPDLTGMLDFSLPVAGGRLVVLLGGAKWFYWGMRKQKCLVGAKKIVIKDQTS